MKGWKDAASWTPVIALVLLILVFSALRPSIFLTVGNLRSVLNQQAVLVLVALGLTQVLIIGQFDLSFGSVMSIAGAVSAGLVSKTDTSVGSAIFAVLGIGIVVGLANGVIVELFGVNALVATLAVASLLDGATLWYTNGETIFKGIPPSFLTVDRWTAFGVQGAVFYMLLLCLVLWLVARRLPLGRYMYATGSNRTAAQLVGVPVRSMTVLGFVLSSIIAAFAGALQAGHDGSVEPLFGTSYLLPAFAAAFLGASTLSKGSFHVWGSLIGAYLIAIGTNGFVILGAPFYTQQIFAGAMLLVATASPGVLSVVKSSFASSRRPAMASTGPPVSDANHPTKPAST
ncbi:MAG: ABC transporter permease [Candidatus Velthaea sp.]